MNREIAQTILTEGGEFALFQSIKDGDVHADGWGQCPDCHQLRPHDGWLCLVCEAVVEVQDEP